VARLRPFVSADGEDLILAKPYFQLEDDGSLSLHLVVDDSPAICKLVCVLLEEMGHSVVQASDGPEALAEVEKRVIDAVITDYHMPKMNGVELIIKLRALHRFAHKPILVLSTEMDPAIKREAKDAGATGFGNKPLNLPVFKSLMERLLG
jgi:two-component system chemotaxis response regulator CheY